MASSSPATNKNRCGDEEAEEVNKSFNALEYLKIFEMMTIMLAMKMRRQMKSTKAPQVSEHIFNAGDGTGV